ncbi:DUF5908 family protein [Pinibacter aurantiacus]|uniref:Uncharacterized protein n=1 Tax=Pinibacter aurantiacus TaxID=2851599 RepID=A0A9E2SFN1_9BACT|nr:DUF5908 family protein [Pinibacter aurantiacus]MBV4360539.1 hypothetical protein [Pinibacter aurantiacus]
MPVQINEMVVKANVVENGKQQADPKGAQTQSSAVDKEEIIRECTEIILEILKNKNER